jgi:hypothetical protein
LKRIPLSLARSEKEVTSLPPVSREEAIAFLKSTWQKTPDTYAFFNQGQENVFVVVPEGPYLAIRIRVYDAFGLLGFVGKQKAIELDFGLLELTDVERLMKLFWEGNYLALRAVHRGLLT